MSIDLLKPRINTFVRLVCCDKNPVSADTIRHLFHCSADILILFEINEGLGTHLCGQIFPIMLIATISICNTNWIRLGKVHTWLGRYLQQWDACPWP